MHNHKNEKDENTEKTEETIKNEIIRTRKATINDVEFENKQGFSTTTITITAKENIKNLKIEVTLLDKNRKNLVKYDRTAGNLQKGETKEIELSLELLSFLDRYKIEYVYYEVTEGTVEY